MHVYVGYIDSMLTIFSSTNVVDMELEGTFNDVSGKDSCFVYFAL